MPAATLAPVAPTAAVAALPEVDQGDQEFDIHGVAWPATPVLTPEMAVLTELHAAFDAWEGTPYLFGGTSRSGLDCSAFVQRVFAENFALGLTRSTSTQVREGQEVSLDELRPGDLVFFQTGRRLRHVGIYLQGGRFLHASTTRGVTTDNLTSGYYQRTFWTARRVLSDDRIAALVPSDQAPAGQQVHTVRTTRPNRPTAPPIRAGVYGVSVPGSIDASATPNRRAGW